MSKPSKDEDRLAAIAAYLSSGHNGRSPLSQAEISDWKLLGLTSQSAVSRALIRARKQGYFRDAAPTLDLKRLDADGVHDDMEHFASMIELSEKVRALATLQEWPRVPELHCIPVRVNMEAATEVRRRDIRSFFEQAGAVVHGLIKDCGAVGVSWGETLSNTISALEERMPPRSSNQRRIRKVVPLVGEPPAGETSEFSSTLLAERLYRALGGAEPAQERYSLRYVHSFISDDLAKVHMESNLSIGRRLAFEYYAQVSSYRKIFIGTDDGEPRHRPLVDSLDSILTSLSSDGVPWGTTTQFGEPARGKGRAQRPRVAYMLPTDGEVMKAVKQAAIGDICGVLLSEETAQHQDLRDDLQHRWTGIKPEQLRKHADRSASSGAPGVIVVAFGQKKVMTTLTAMRMGYVNHLVIGEALAQELNKQITHLLPHRRRHATAT